MYPHGRFSTLVTAMAEQFGGKRKQEKREVAPSGSSVT